MDYRQYTVLNTALNTVVLVGIVLLMLAPLAPTPKPGAEQVAASRWLPAGPKPGFTG